MLEGDAHAAAMRAAIPLPLPCPSYWEGNIFLNDILLVFGWEVCGIVAGILRNKWKNDCQRMGGVPSGEALPFFPITTL
jgi:hypothetical protein